MRRRAEEARAQLAHCRLCPQECGVDRTAGQTGKCRTGDTAILASYGPHFGEEAPLVGAGGSGAIFFSGCNLRCVFCQNHTISHGTEGEPASAQEIARIMLHLQNTGCHNINLVSPSHVVPFLLEAVDVAAAGGLGIPLVYNTGGYDSIETLRLLDGVIDIYMPDMKYGDVAAGLLYSGAKDYPAFNRAAVKEMHRQVGDLHINDEGIAERGLLVRHLVMPGGLAGTKEVMAFLAREVSVATYVNIMAQYRPAHMAVSTPALSRRITREEHDTALRAARRHGLRLDGEFYPRSKNPLTRAGT